MKEVTEKYLRRRIRKFLRVKNLYRTNPNLGFSLQNNFEDLELSKTLHFNHSEPFMVLSIKTKIVIDYNGLNNYFSKGIINLYHDCSFYIIGIQFIQEDQVGWLMVIIPEDKLKAVMNHMRKSILEWKI